jgi:hypothetical protein
MWQRNVAKKICRNKDEENGFVWTQNKFGSVASERMGDKKIQIDFKNQSVFHGEVLRIIF